MANKFKGLKIDLPICQSAREEANSMGFNQGRDEKLPVTKTEAGRAD
jgi:hypothetical protein